MWAMGCVLYEMMALTEPFRAKAMEGLMRLVQHGQPPELPNAYSDELKGMCMRMLSKDPNERPSAAELIRESAALRAACASTLSDAGATAASAAAGGAVPSGAHVHGVRVRCSRDGEAQRRADESTRGGDRG